jgi:16S rRNA (guanine527-N7)-methyltransferase
MQIIGKYFTSLSLRQTEQFSQLGPLYQLWNQRINVISRKDIDNLYLHHVLHSLSIAKVITFNPGTVVIDAGTGGGFPGIPLAILFPRTHFILVDSIRKKTIVVEEIINATGLKNCSVKNLRLEDLKDKGSFVVCRAVSDIPKIYNWVGKNISSGEKHLLKNGLLALKGGDLSSELESFAKTSKVFDLSDYFSEPFFETKKLVHIPVI